MYTKVPLSLYREAASTLGLEVLFAEPTRNEWVWTHRLSAGVSGAIPDRTNQIVVLAKN